MRRRLLAAFGASLPIAGCLSELEEATDPGTDDSNGTESDTPNGSDTECPVEGNSSSEAFSVGETTGDANPHRLTVRNDGNSPRTVELRITTADTDETLFDRSCSLAGGEEISGELRGPAEYEVRVDLPDSEAEDVTTVDYFDTCNDYGTTVTIAADGTITSETVTTDAECDPD